MQTINDIVFYNNLMAVCECIYTCRRPRKSSASVIRENRLIYCAELAKRLILKYILYEIEKYFNTHFAMDYYLLVLTF